MTHPPFPRLLNPDPSFTIGWEGPFFRAASLDKNNREVCWTLALHGWDVRPIANDGVPSNPADEHAQALNFRRGQREPVDAHVRHQFPPRFGDQLGPLYLMQPWEFGAVPDAWVGPINRRVERLIVPSLAVQEMYEVSGVDPARVAVVPSGVNPAIYHPWGPGLLIPELREQVFLYVGGTIPRKGLDVLLQAYGRSFHRDDPVSLVVKSTRIYNENEIDVLLDEFISNPRNPHVVEMRDDLSEVQMAALYRTATFYVAPYRGEGFCSPVLEAMACGTPVIVSDTTPTREFSSARNTLPIPGRRVEFPVAYSDKPGWQFEPDPDALSALLQQALRTPRAESLAMGRRASLHAHAHYTWAHMAERLLQVLHGTPAWVPAPAAYTPPGESAGAAWAEAVPSGSAVLLVPAAAAELEAHERAGLRAAGVLEEGDLREMARRRGLHALSLDEVLAQDAGSYAAVRLDRSRLDIDAAVLTRLQSLVAPGGRLYTRDGEGGTWNEAPCAVEVSSRAAPAPARSRQLIWRGPLGNRTGYASGARPFVRQLVAMGYDVRALDEDGDLPRVLEPADVELFRRLSRLPVKDAPMIQCVPAHGFGRRRFGAEIGRTTFETDGLSPLWAEKCRMMDLLLVPTAFNLETFTAAGVPPEKIRVVPDSVDVDLFRPGGHPARARFRFVSVFDWSQRKGWPELVRGWAAAFRAGDPVELIIKITRIVVPLIDVQRELVDAIRAVGHDPGACAPITVMERDLSDREMAAFYRDADAFVLPTRGEGWGRPIVEAMASGLPVLVTNWSAPATYLTRSNGFPIEYELVPVPTDYPLEAYHGQQWAVANVDHLADTLRFVAEHPEAARNIGRRAQRDVQQFSIERATTRLVEAIRPYLD